MPGARLTLEEREIISRGLVTDGQKIGAPRPPEAAGPAGARVTKTVEAVESLRREAEVLKSNPIHPLPGPQLPPVICPHAPPPGDGSSPSHPPGVAFIAGAPRGNSSGAGSAQDARSLDAIEHSF